MHPTWRCASVSRRLAALEARYGVRVLHRDTHRQALTEAGRELYVPARKIVGELDEAHRSVAVLDGVPRGLLRVGMPPYVPTEIALAERYLAAYPEVELEFVSALTHTDLVAAGLDVSLRLGHIDEEQLIGRRLLSLADRVYASPPCSTASAPPPSTPSTASPACSASDPHGRPVRTWPLLDGGSVPVLARFRSNQAETRLAAARRGIGLTLAGERAALPGVHARGSWSPSFPRSAPPPRSPWSGRSRPL